jgi:hypothetical protein
MGPAANPAALVACSAVYLVVVIGGVLWVERARGGRAALMTVLFVLGSAAVWISHGATILILMPIVSLFVLWCSLRSVVALTALLGVVVVIARWRFGTGTMGGVSDFGSAAVFTVIFSRLVVKERMVRDTHRTSGGDVDAQNRQLSGSEYASSTRHLSQRRYVAPPVAWTLAKPTIASRGDRSWGTDARRRFHRAHREYGRRASFSRSLSSDGDHLDQRRVLRHQERDDLLRVLAEREGK